ncbi:FtsW/RodA/SpoVE family cell cycle protein [Haloglycomyces albus]|uniref:FtsW/RodA/SpoVE family cell cycle protein n=1 Tax=Haloglycomyces albus TaxID=526067 RepID=UPI00046D7D7C|nr:FtsW/RodA/SpoVE family cell cycle protein [Haloglycomyces albus]
MAQAVSARAQSQKSGELSLTPMSGMPRRTGRSITLLVLAMVVIVVFAVAIELGEHGFIASNALLLAGVLCVVLLVQWLAVRRFAPYADPVIVLAAGLLSGIGVLFLRRLSLSQSTDPVAADAGIFSGSGGRQLVFVLIATVVFAVVLMVLTDHRLLRSVAYTLGFGGIVLAALPGLLPAAISERNGAKNWIIVGPFSFQPSEFAKLMLLVFFAYYLYQKRDVLGIAGKKFMGLQFPRLRDFGPIIIMWLASMAILVLENDLGSSLLFFGLFMALLYMATRRLSWIVIGLLLFMGGCVAIYPFFAHLQLRVRIWLDPFNPELVDNQSYQLVQGLIGLGSGGLLGTGPGQGEPNIIPFAGSDFILASFGEEIGLAGLTAILVLYAILVERAFKSGVTVKDGFGKLVASGLGFSIAFQVFVVAGGVSGLIPLTGLTTPFLAAGGSSMLASWILIALLARISHASRQPWSPSYGLRKVQPPPDWKQQYGHRPVAAVEESGDIAPAGVQDTQLILAADSGEIVSPDVSEVTSEPDIVDSETDETSEHQPDEPADDAEEKRER